MDNELFTGVVGDPRLDVKVKNGWKLDEVLAESAPLNWNFKNNSELVKYPVWNQGLTSACVAFSKAKQLSIRVFNITGVWIDFSPASIYQLRSNRPDLGMHISDANEIVNNSGATLEALMKSQNLTELQINTVLYTKVAKLFAKATAEAVASYLYVAIDIDRIAQAIEAGKAVSLLIFATFDEYSRQVPVVLNPTLTYAQAPIRHEVVAVDYFLDASGQKKILINDSSPFGGFSVREFSADFLQKRCILADALDVFTFEPSTDNKPVYDGTIISIQKCLRYEGLFPTDVDFVEILGPITRRAISAFQVRYGLHPTGTGTVGPLTEAKLKELYS